VSSTELARSVLQALIEDGVSEVVIAPGSRNAPLSFAAHDASVAGLVRLHTRMDERSAGFLALGLTKVGARAAVVCTSGTAVANLHPAVLEAAHSGIALVVVTADRPARLRGTDANQTTDQVGIFGRLVETHDLDAATEPPPLSATGPTHLNVQLDDPLVPPDGWAVDRASFGPPPRGPGLEHRGPVTHRIPRGPLTVVVAGDDAGPPARMLAERAGWPLLAEPSSGSRNGATTIRCYRLLLDGELGRRVERAVVLGHPTLSRPVMRLLQRTEVVSVTHPSAWSERPYDVASTIEGGVDCEGADDPAWLEEWRAADRDVSRRLDALLAEEEDLTPYEVAGAVSRAVPAEGLFVIGASSPIRDLDLMARPYTVGERRKIIANRGLSGIDGTVSTAVGAALGRPHSSRSIALMGDVTFLHDSNGLVLGPGQPRPDLTIVVVNDDGGSIFSMLEQGDPAYATSYDALFGTPHGVDLASLCAATGTPHWRVDSLAELEHALASPNGGIEVIEARVRRDNRRELDRRIRALVPGTP
jgi:2-succinyl-5-enolpyruvyl-6-hydroxy-3-cyclohexene-1-carboxylate synthase